MYDSVVKCKFTCKEIIKENVYRKKSSEEYFVNFFFSPFRYMVAERSWRRYRRVPELVPPVGHLSKFLDVAGSPFGKETTVAVKTVG